MPWLFIVAAVVWVVISAIGRAQKLQKKAEEAQRELDKTQTARPAAQPMLPRPTVQPPPRPTVYTAPRPVAQAHPSHQAAQVPKAQLFMEGEGAYEGPAAPRISFEAEQRRVESTQRHALTPSSVSGHAHEETSMSGIEPDCPPETTPAEKSRAIAAEEQQLPGLPVFTWDQNAVLDGLIYAEILGKPKALRG